MVKPLVMGIIGGVIGAIAIIGGLFAFPAYQDYAEFQKFHADFLIASSHQSEIDEFLIETCVPFYMPTSLDDAIKSLKRHELNLQKVIQNEDRIESLRQQIENIRQEYSGTDYYDLFNFQDYECAIGDLNRAIELLENYIRSP